jgi:hypothetical protein
MRLLGSELEGDVCMWSAGVDVSVMCACYQQECSCSMYIIGLGVRWGCTRSAADVLASLPLHGAAGTTCASTELVAAGMQGVCRCTWRGVVR